MLEDRAQPMQANAPAFLNGKRVLIVEDQSLVGLALKESLQDAGADVVWVQSDRAAYTALQGNGLPFDVLILDVDLGHGTTGFDIARFARQRDPDVGVIFSSGSPPDWINTFGVPGAMFVPKPCSADAMSSAVTLLAKDRERTAASS
jgi:DNA-binding response OmpR family regulator